MQYTIVYSPRLPKQVKKLPAKTILRLLELLPTLSENPRALKAIKLTDFEAYRIRLGDFRLLYKIDDKQKIVFIDDIQKREKDTYR